MKNNIINEKIIYNCIALIFFMNSIQIILNWLFGIQIHMLIEYIILAIIIILSKVKVINMKSLIFILCSLIIFFTSGLFFYNTLWIEYFKAYFFMGLILSLIILINIDVKKLIKYLLIYATVVVTLYLLCLVVNIDIVIHEYMTWGYHYVLALSIIEISAIIYRKKLIMAMLIPLIGIGFIYGPKGAFMIMILALLVASICSVENKNKRNLFIVIIGVLGLYTPQIVYLLAVNIREKFDINTYAINSLIMMLEKTSFKEIFYNRSDIYIESVNTILQHPNGLGIGTFHSMYGMYPHNFFIELFLTFGVIGGGILLMFLIGISIKAIKSIVTKEDLIIYIFIVVNFSKLMISKSFIQDQAFWAYIVFSILLINNKVKSRSNRKWI